MKKKDRRSRDNYVTSTQALVIFKNGGLEAIQDLVSAKKLSKKTAQTLAQAAHELDLESSEELADYVTKQWPSANLITAGDVRYNKATSIRGVATVRVYVRHLHIQGGHQVRISYEEDRIVITKPTEEQLAEDLSPTEEPAEERPVNGDYRIDLSGAL